MTDDDELERLEGAKRWMDVVRLLEERAASPARGRAEQIEALLRVMRIYVERLANHALAIGAAERVRALEPTHDEAVAFLREAYGRRGEHAKLATLPPIR